MAQTYFAIFTAVGEAKDANAKALGLPMIFTEMAVGDGNGLLPVPDRTRTALVNEVRRAPLNQLSRDPVNTNQVIAEQVIPENVGGWWVREIGLYDADGDLVAIANCPPTYKPQLAEGSGRTQVVRMVLIVSSADTVQLKIDPAVVLATRKYADDAITASMNAHLAAANPHPKYVRKDAAQGLTDAEKQQARRNINAEPGGNVTTVNFASSPFALTADHAGMVLVDAAAGNVVLNLPAAKVLAGLPYAFRRVDATANTVTVNRAGADTIDEGGVSFALTSKAVQQARSNGVATWSTVTPVAATQAETDAGTDDAKFVTPKKLRFGFSASLTANGYIAFPSWLGGLIIQWGSRSITSGAAGTATQATGSFPIAFPVGAIFMSGYHNSADSTYLNSGAAPLSASTYQVSLISGISSLTRSVLWIAIGR